MGFYRSIPFILLAIFTLSVTVQLSEVRAITYTVNTLDDHDDDSCDINDCTLREAIETAQSNCWDEKDRITFSVAGTIRLLSPLPDLTCPLVIDGGHNILVSGDSDYDGDADVSYALRMLAYDGSDDPDEELLNLKFEKFVNSALVISPSGQVLVEDIEVSSSGIGIAVYSNDIGTTRVTLDSLNVHDNSLQGIYVGPSSAIGSTDVRLKKSVIWGNGLQGIWIDATAGSGIRDVSIGDPNDPESGNYVYSNGAEGILLSGDVQGCSISYNRVGVDFSGNPAPNGDGPGPNGDG